MVATVRAGWQGSWKRSSTGATGRANGQVDASGLLLGPTADAIFQELCALWSECPWLDPVTDRREMLQRAELSLPSCYILEDACREFERDWKTLPNVSNLREMIVKHFQRWEASRFSRAFIVRYPWILIRPLPPRLCSATADGGALEDERGHGT